MPVVVMVVVVVKVVVVIVKPKGKELKRKREKKGRQTYVVSPYSLLLLSTRYIMCDVAHLQSCIVIDRPWELRCDSCGMQWSREDREEVKVGRLTWYECKLWSLNLQTKMKTKMIQKKTIFAKQVQGLDYTIFLMFKEDALILSVLPFCCKCHIELDAFSWGGWWLSWKLCPPQTTLTQLQEVPLASLLELDYSVECRIDAECIARP